MRCVGTLLLELIVDNISESITSKSHLYLSQLLECLSRLDSKASDELASRVV